MNKYNPHIHNRKSTRLKGYDYSQDGAYFITICCHEHNCLFGEVINGEMVLNAYGKIAYNEWSKTPEIRNNVELDVFVIMPNHLHGIIILNGGRGESNSPDTNIKSHLQNTTDKSNSPQCGTSNTVGAIVRGFKSAVTKQLNELNIDCKIWQRNYYDHIIRNEESYINISNYIINNPEKWEDDKFYRK
ncbi:transposase [Aureibaculum sp. 2210JD6-5]|uniref:transposase n=1 Tax=Aureibaculum sp. 2210JD6-5 TaxID=3103957 RepID=UPI002AAD5CEA|nr:transposase [Aureibaculum sp. 2210JD6-5]MDY7394850.1 transposase [Aureibaculum sp. 2210JD6-5]